jgi:hypothetical protein
VHFQVLHASANDQAQGNQEEYNDEAGMSC